MENFLVTLPFSEDIALSPENIIQIISICASLITSVVAIVISLKTLQQNSKMIRDSSRPYVSIFFHPLFNLDYLILKNFGNSTAKIISIETNVDFCICIDDDSHFPFSHIAGTYLHPGERILSPISQAYKLCEKYDFLVFDIVYEASEIRYQEHMEINLNSYADHASIRPVVNPDNAQQIIAKTLQDISENLM